MAVPSIAHSADVLNCRRQRVPVTPAWRRPPGTPAIEAWSRPSDVYEWAPGGFFVVHSAFGKIGETTVGGVEIIGVDGEAYRSTFYESFGNVHRSRLEIEGDVIRWIGDRTRCTVTMTDDGMTQVAHHESSADGVSWTASMDVTLRKVA